MPAQARFSFFKMFAVCTEFVGIIYVLELIAMWYLRLQPELPTLCHGPNATARAAQPYSLKGNQARTRADKSLAMAPYVQPAPLERAAWAAKLEYGPVPATCRIISRFRNSQTVKHYFRFFSWCSGCLKFSPWLFV